MLRIAGAVLPGDYQTVSFAEAHPEFGRRNRPGAGWKKTSEYTSWIEINSKGLRGAEIDYPKPPGEYRILVTGDSFTFAEQVNQQETFTQRLEDRLNAERHRASGTGCSNAGSNGWATANEAVYLTKEGVRFRPDVVVVALYLGNDVSDNYRRVATVQNAVEADLALRGADSFDGPRRILRRSELYTVFESGVLAKLPWWQDDGGSSSSDRRPPRTLAEAEEAWTITERLLDRMRDVSESQGARFMVMVVPSATAVAQRGGAGVKETDEDDEDERSEDDDEPGLRGSARHARRADRARQPDDARPPLADAPGRQSDQGAALLPPERPLDGGRPRRRGRRALRLPGRARPPTYSREQDEPESLEMTHVEARAAEAPAARRDSAARSAPAVRAPGLARTVARPFGLLVPLLAAGGRPATLRADPPGQLRHRTLPRSATRASGTSTSRASTAGSRPASSRPG